MIANTASVLEDRSTTGRFEPDFEIDRAAVGELIRLATRAPSAFHMQNWSFVAAHSKAAKNRLEALAFGQRQVRDAAVTYIVCGVLEAHVPLHSILQPSVDAGIISSSVQSAWVEMATQSHRDDPRHQRDEAIRSASLATMSLVIAARELGFDSGIVGGFDPEGVREAFELSQLELPVMLVTVGRAATGNWPQKIRRPVEEVLRFT